VDPGLNRKEEEPDIFAFTTEGELVFSVSSSRYVTWFGAAPLGEDGAPLLLVGTNDARLVAFSADGTHRWTHELGGGWLTYVAALFVADLDDDGASEIYLALEGDGDGATLLSIAPDGTEHFRSSLDRRVAWIDGLAESEAPRLLLAFEGFPEVS